MECPYCNEELEYHDYYGYGIPQTRDFEKIGEIYKCENDDCEGHLFYTNRSGDLIEGYPC